MAARDPNLKKVPPQTKTTAAAAKGVIANKAVQKAKAAKATTLGAAVGKKQTARAQRVRARSRGR